MSLTKKLTGLYHHVYFDNYFTSISLLINLLKIGIYSCGTMRTNRKGSPDDLKAVAKKGFTERGQRYGSTIMLPLVYGKTPSL